MLTLAVLAITAYWREHLQMLAYPATLIGAAILTVLSTTRWSKLGAIGACAFVAFALWSSLKNPGGLEISTAWRTKPISAGAIALERARKRFDPQAQRVTYMVFGSNSENGHAAFIGHQFDLVCRWFQLYPFSSPDQFDETTRCATRQSPEFVLVTLGYFDTPADGSAWAEFVANTRNFLDDGYKLVEEEAPAFQVWRRTSGRSETQADGHEPPDFPRIASRPLACARRARLARRPRRGAADVALFHELAPPPSGGGHQFLRALVGELERRGLDVELNRLSAGTRVCLFNSFNFDAARLRRFARADARMVHRVDGPIGVYRGYDDGTDRSDRRAELGARGRDGAPVALQPREAPRARHRAALARRDPEHGRPGALPPAGRARPGSPAGRRG